MKTKSTSHLSEDQASKAMLITSLIEHYREERRKVRAMMSAERWRVKNWNQNISEWREVELRAREAGERMTKQWMQQAQTMTARRDLALDRWKRLAVTAAWQKSQIVELKRQLKNTN